MATSAGRAARALGAAWLFACALGPIASAASPLWRSWTVLDGLEESYAKSVAVATDGLVYVRHGEQHRMTVLDGHHLTVRSDLLTGDDLVAGEGGEIWSATTDLLIVTTRAGSRFYPLPF